MSFLHIGIAGRRNNGAILSRENAIESKRSVGGGLALTIWISYMGKALKNIPIEERRVPEGIIAQGGEYYYAENPPGVGIDSLEGATRGTPAEEKQKDAVKNELF